ncbi:MAG: thioredoxin family protein [Planctomycetota bacterium]|mgnify:CR=1 FL=1
MRRNLVTCTLVAILMLCCSIAEATDWETDFKKASSAARTSGKYILLGFSGSDWCGWCIKLEKEVFSQDAFKDFAKENLVCVLVDFPSAKKQTRELKQQNWNLATKYGIKGYPTIIILSPDGEPVGKTGYLQGGPGKYTQHLNEIIERHKAERKEK